MSKNKEQVCVSGTEFDVFLTAYSGESFRFIQTSENEFENVAFGKVLRLKKDGNNVNFDCTREEYEKIWKHYFDLDFDYTPVKKAIADGDDDYLKSAVELCGGIKILNQEPFEALISFIISQQMQIPRIRKAVNLLSETYGTQIDDQHFTFPSVNQLTAANTTELENMKLGYRSEYIASAVEKIASGSFDLEKIYNMDYDEAKTYLKTLKGVGEKVANCVLLFAYHKTDAFPVDTWIKKIINKYYNGKFNYKQYGKYAGIVQQYMFCYERFKDNKLR